ncbi:MAG: KH domain-containing protein [Deltaproteobacteria bacterium]|nr:KH domain-containing protein [Deltaproteobacteria bacterium]
MKELIICMTRALVDNPEDVNVKEVNGGQTSIYELRVAREDIGKVIGKEGKNAKAMRTIVNAAISKQHKRAFLEIID